MWFDGRFIRMKRTIFSFICAFALFASAENYVGLAGFSALPQGGSRVERGAGASIRGGRYLTEALALEVEAGLHEREYDLGAVLVGHWFGWELYDRFFGYSAFDPFVTVGARGFWRDSRGQVGPSAGFGAFYHLDDRWSVRADVSATLGVDTRAEVVHTLSLGLQYGF